MAKITVLGSGGWGTALALAAERQGHTVFLWSPFEAEIGALLADREHKKLLAGVKIPETITITTDFLCVEGSDITIVAVPSLAVRETAVRLKAIQSPGIVVNVAKGLEPDTLIRLSQVLRSELPAARVAVLSGPSHAEEVARNVPTTLVAASADPSTAEQVQETLMSKTLRIYTNDDIVGVELGGAFKNIIALAAGICDGLGMGDNTKAALMTRGLTEIARLGVALGAHQQTFAGLAGIGDLVVTCTSMHSRNRRFGILIGQMVPAKEALEQVGTVEGYHATRLARQLAAREGVEMPITEQCYRVLYENFPPLEAIKSLMSRPGKNEHERSWISSEK